MRAFTSAPWSQSWATAAGPLRSLMRLPAAAWQSSPALVVGVADARRSRRGQEQLDHRSAASAGGEANQRGAAFAQRTPVAAGLEPRPHRFDVAAASGLNDRLRGDRDAFVVEERNGGGRPEA